MALAAALQVLADLSERVLGSHTVKSTRINKSAFSFVGLK